jgi:DNA-binding CsgD family transcriptional regulator
MPAGAPFTKGYEMPRRPHYKTDKKARTERNKDIKRLSKMGKTQAQIARKYQLTPGRIGQILKGICV